MSENGELRRPLTLAQVIAYRRRHDDRHPLPIIHHVTEFIPQETLDTTPFSTVTHVTFEPSFNRSFTITQLPAATTHLVLGQDYNQPIGARTDTQVTPTARRNSSLPSTLLSLSFGPGFNRKLKHNSCPPASTLGTAFRQPLYVGVLPNSLTALTFSKHSFDSEFRPTNFPLS